MKKLFTKECTNYTHSASRGFTLIEILLAIGILAILATAVIIAINPSRQFAEARDAQRWSDVNTLMNAIYQYSVSHKGALPPDMPTDNNFLEICRTDADSCIGLYAMRSLTEDAKYLTAIPIDPSCSGSCVDEPNGTGYFVTANTDGRIDIQARYAELGDVELIR